MLKTIRSAELTPKILIIDGLPGCGKTMLSPIASALDRVEKLTFAFEVEIMCHLWTIGKLDLDTTKTMVRIFTDMKMYNMMMGREVNFRIKDLSGVFMDGQPWRYIERIFGPGDEVVPERVKTQQPILHLTTHQLLSIGRPVFEALGDRLVLVDVVRHPLYMIKQQALNMEKLIADARYFNVHVDYKGHEIPFWTQGWEEEFLHSNDVERAVHSIVRMGEKTEESQKLLSEELSKNIVTIPFEKFVLDPDFYMESITTKLGTKIIPATLKMMKKQKVPRQRIAQGIDLPVYRRYDWKPASGADEIQELVDRRNWMLKQVSSDLMRVFDERCKKYEREYLDEEQDISGRE